MSMIRKFAVSFAAMAAAATLSIAHAQAADPVIQQARAQGVVGETAAGYLAVADESKATPDIKRHVEETNAKRLSLYTDLAKQSGETVSNVAGVTAEKQISRAAPGEMVKPATGSWTKKQ